MDVVERIGEIEEDVATMLAEGAHEELAAYATCYAVDALRLSLLCGRLKTALISAREQAAKTEQNLAETRSERDASDERWAAVCRERDVAVRERDVAVRERDVARAERDVARAERDAALARPCVGHPTPEERAAHIDAGGEWVMVWRDGDGEWLCCSTSEHSNTVADASYIPARDGLPCAWPVVPAAQGAPQ